MMSFVTISHVFTKTALTRRHGGLFRHFRMHVEAQLEPEASGSIPGPPRAPPGHFFPDFSPLLSADAGRRYIYIYIYIYIPPPWWRGGKNACSHSSRRLTNPFCRLAFRGFVTRGLTALPSSEPGASRCPPEGREGLVTLGLTRPKQRPRAV